MKVIHLISGGDTGGAKTHVHSLLQGLGRHIQADMVCFTDGPFTQEARDLGIHVDVMASRDPLAALKPLREKIAREGYDIIHCHGARGNLMGALLRRSTGLPVVTTVHSDPKLDYMGRPLSALTYGTLNAWALRRIPYHIGVSDAMSELLISRGFDPQQMFAIYNGIDFTPRTPRLDRRGFLDSLGLDWPDDVVIAGIAARLNPVKDMGTLLRGFAAAHAQQPKLRLIIAGEGPDEAMLRQLAGELGVSDQVCFAGWLSDTDSFYNALDQHPHFPVRDLPLRAHRRGTVRLAHCGQPGGRGPFPHPEPCHRAPVPAQGPRCPGPPSRRSGRGPGPSPQAGRTAFGKRPHGVLHREHHPPAARYLRRHPPPPGAQGPEAGRRGDLRGLWPRQRR